MTSFVKLEGTEGDIHVSTVNVDADIGDTPYEPETRAAELDLLDLAKYGQIEVADDTPSVFEPVVTEDQDVEPEPLVTKDAEGDDVSPDADEDNDFDGGDFS